MKTQQYEAIIEMLRCDPELTQEYLSATLEDIAEPGGEAAFLAVLREVAMTRGGIAQIAAATGEEKAPPSPSPK